MKKFLAGLIVIAVICLVPLQNGNKVEGTFTQVSTQKVQVAVSSLIMRSGAGTSHQVLTHLSKGTVLDVLGKIGSWYVVKTASDGVGCVRDSYVKPYTPSTTTTATVPTTTPAPATTPTAVQGPNSLAMQQEMLQYVNDERAKVGASPLTLTAKLSDGAYLKSKDMADNNYFSHTSPTYGSPFDMMKSLGISYMSAGENIAMNSSVKGAHDAFMNSSGHRANILNTGYTKVGFGFVQKGSYLYVTQWFTN